LPPYDFNANLPSLSTTSLSITFPSPDNERIEVQASGEYHFVFLSLFGKDSTTVSARAVAGAQATDVMIALDRSGSMCRDSHGLRLNCPASAPAHEPMTSVKAAANGFGELFEPGYARMGLVSFSTEATLDQMISSDFGAGSSLEAAVADIYPSGRTNIGDAIAEAIDEVMYGSATRQDALKVIVLLSDGVPNHCAGGSSCTEYAAANYARARASEAAALGITIYAIGLGSNLDEALMQDIADIGNGAYIQSPTADDLDATFDEIAAMIKVRILE
jgi:von Willebrand factor type A domain-containing protein